MDEELKHKILIIDRDEKHFAQLKELLEKNNYVVRGTSFLVQSLNEIQTWQPELVILDIFIKTLNPLELIEKIKRNPFTENQKIIILSEVPKIETLVGPSPRIRGYFTKPIDFEELKNTLRNITEKTSSDFPQPIMVVDDDEDFSDLIKRFLEVHNYKPIIVNDPSNLIRRIKTEKPCAILLDIMMPQKDGFKIMDELQDELETSVIPIIVLSAIRFNNYQEKGILTGFPEMISKEIPQDMLLNIIEKKIKETTQTILSEHLTQKPKVLIADDQTDLLLLIKETVEKAGFEVLTANDGQEAMTVIFENNPDIVVLDYDMPIKDGLTIAQELKDNPLFAHIPIIILTAFGEKKIKLKGLSMGIDDYLIKPVDNDELIARIKMILKRNKQVLDTNPLSKLPGNPSIQARIEREISRGSHFAVLYIDLNNFKSYNDVYGFEAGDRVIRTTANLLVKFTRQNENSDDFIGHIGGDDFIIVTSFENAEDLCKRIIKGFDEIAPSFYTREDRERGYIVSTDRQGNIKKFTFLSISIGVVHNKFRPLTSFAQVSNIGTELKKYAKSSNLSNYVFDRRK